MKYLCLGYYDQVKMDALRKEEIDEIMRGCQPYMEQLYNTGQVMIDAGITAEIKCLRQAEGKVVVTDGPFVETKEMIGSALIIEAQDMEDAIRVASMHPSVQIGIAEPFGSRMEIWPIHYFEKKE